MIKNKKNLKKLIEAAEAGVSLGTVQHWGDVCQWSGSSP